MIIPIYILLSRTSVYGQYKEMTETFVQAFSTLDEAKEVMLNLVNVHYLNQIHNMFDENLFIHPANGYRIVKTGLDVKNVEEKHK